MSRNDKRRRRARKARRRARMAEDESYRARGELPPRLRLSEPSDKPKQEGNRWGRLQARGGLVIGFTPTGVRVPFDFDDPRPENALAEALARRLHRDPGES